MRTVGMMLVDLESSRLGLPSRAGEDLAGRPVLRRSVTRALAARALDQVAVLAPAGQHVRLRALLGDLADDRRVSLAALPAEVDGKMDSARVRLARRWALSCWRGGISGACWFDELLAPAAMSVLAGELAAEAVVLLSPEAALTDPALIDAIVEQHLAHRERYRMAFSQAPPGLGTVCMAGDLPADLARTGRTIGRLLAYDPAEPRSDLVSSDATVKVPLEVMACPHRFLADTARGRWLLERVVGLAGDGPSAEQATRLADSLLSAGAEPWPREIELELTTERAVSDVVRPGRPLVPARGPASDELVELVCESVRRWGADDLLVTLGGFGDALAHPRWSEIASAVRQAGALAVAIRTGGLALDAPTIDRLLGSAVDVVVVELDANSPAGYLRLKGVDGFERVTGGMERLLTERSRRGQAGPLLVAEMVKCPATLEEMEGFFDRWRFADESHLAGLHDYAGRFVSSAGPGWPTASPRRRPCVRINRRMTVLADGTVVACEQDFAPVAGLGRLAPGEPGLAEIWSGPAMGRLRQAHREMKLDELALCRACDQWHQP